VIATILPTTILAAAGTIGTVCGWVAWTVLLLSELLNMVGAAESDPFTLMIACISTVVSLVLMQTAWFIGPWWAILVTVVAGPLLVPAVIAVATWWILRNINRS